MSPVEEWYDFVARHADTHAVLGSGETVLPAGPLPRDAGIHVVAGLARLGGTRSVGVLPAGTEIFEPTEVSPDHRWLAAEREGAFVLHELRGGLRQGFSFQLPGSRLRSVHPSGEMVAVRIGGEVQVHLPDGEVLTRAVFEGKAGALDNEALTFSACGKYLWFAHVPPEGNHRLLLLRVPTLEVADSVPVPHDPGSYYDGPGVGWRELTVSVNPVTNHVVLNRSAGDSFLSVSFLRARRGKIGGLCHLSVQDRLFEGEPVHDLAFAPDGGRFAGWDRGGLIYEWKWPECRVESKVWDHELRGADAPYLHVEEIAYHKGLLLVTIGRGGLHLLHSGSLKPAGVLPLCLEGIPLPNGMLLAETREGNWEVRELRVSRQEVPVVIELDSECGLALRVLRRQESGWRDIAAEVTWVVPNFDVARGE